MGKVWILDTETKGTGAHVAPLEKARKRPAARREPIYVPPEPAPKAPPAPEPRAPRQFKVVDVMTNQVLAEGAGARATVDVLKDVRSVVDVRVYVWDDTAERWRLLTLGERKALWRFRDAT
jgi:hypothetical protein